MTQVKLLYASTRDRDTYYIVRNEIGDPFFVVDTGNERLVYLDQREFGIVKEKNIDGKLSVVQIEPVVAEAMKQTPQGPGAGRIAFYIIRQNNLEKGIVQVSRNLPLDVADYLREQGIKLEIVSQLYPERAVKEVLEVEHVREALRRTGFAFRHIEKVLADSTIDGDVILYKDKPLTSEFLKNEVEHILLDHDMVNTEGIIIAGGVQGSIPHHPGSGELRSHFPIVCDIFPQHRATGYFADMTRTFVKGKPSAELQRMYEAVEVAQQRAIDAVRSGQSFASLHSIASEYFAAQKFITDHEQGFTHSVGHGLGLEVHEPPFVRRDYDEVLQAGHIITIEPGLYYPALGGVRLEDVVVVTEHGSENLTNYNEPWIVP